MEIWEKTKNIEKIPYIHARNEFAKNIANLEPEEILSRYTYQNMKTADNLWGIIESYCKINKSGIGVELGAGTGLFSTAQIKRGGNKIYAVEIVPKMVECIIPKITNYFLKNESSKIIPVLGSFDRIKLPNNSVSYIFEYDSFHHSFNLDNTLNESYRILEKNGVLILIDRCHPDSLTEDEIDSLLSINLSKKQLKEMGLPIMENFSRRDNGENEYRKREWLNSINNAGFNIHYFRTFYPKVNLKQVYWYLLSKCKNQEKNIRNLLFIYLAQKVGIHLSDYSTITPMRETGFDYKTIAILVK